MAGSIVARTGISVGLGLRKSAIAERANVGEVILGGRLPECHETQALSLQEFFAEMIWQQG